MEKQEEIWKLNEKTANDRIDVALATYRETNAERICMHEQRIQFAQSIFNSIYIGDFFVDILKTEWQLIEEKVFEEVCLNRTRNIFSILCLDFDIDSS